MKKLIVPLLLIVTFLTYSHHARLSHNQLHIYFLDIGQGDSVLIQTPGNHLILVDGGPGTEILTELNDILPYLQKKIDLVILTHPHADHIEGFVPVLERYEVSTALITGVDYSNAYYEEFLRDLQEEAQIYYAHEDSDFAFEDGVEIDVLYPFEPIIGEEFENLNNSSIVLKIIFEKNTILLAGDAEVEVEKELLESGVSLEADVFKASHHGSRTANSCDFLEVVDPEVVVIQVGEENQFDHPHEETLQTLEELGIEVYRNDLDGRVEVVF